MLEAVPQARPIWADHRRPKSDLAFESAKAVGLNIERA
jgi:hypothetical protein